MASCDVQTLLDAGACFLSRNPEERSAIGIQLLCEILQAGGGSGNSCLLCGDVDPVAAPPCTCALSYNKAKGALWIWDNDILIWELIFSLVP